MTEHIHFHCPHGHSVKAKATLAGKMAKCPACEAVMLIPEPTRLQIPRGNSALTESAVMRILGDAAPLPSPPEKIIESPRNCPRCHKALPGYTTICDGCKLYVGLNPTKRPASNQAMQDWAGF